MAKLKVTILLFVALAALVRCSHDAAKSTKRSGTTAAADITASAPTSVPLASTADPTGVSADSCAAPQRTPLQRLTRLQYGNIVSDMMTLSDKPSLVLPADDDVGGMAINTLSQPGDLTISQYESAALALAQQYAAKPNAALPCKIDAVTTACARSFVAQFGQSAFRRPLTADEVNQYAALAAPLLAANDGLGAVQQVVSAFLQSPYFLYRPELGQAGDASSNTAVLLTSYELAARLSFSLWQTAPDAALIAAAGSGALDTTAGVTAQAQRLVGDARFGATGAAFATQLTGLAPASAPPSKDAASFPSYNGALYAAMVQETSDFAAYVYTKGDARLESLLAANYTLLTEPLFAYYGIVKPSGWTLGQPVPLTKQRAGLFTQAAVMANKSHNITTSPVARGKMIRENFMCQSMPPPPANVPALPAINPKGLSEKQVMSMHESNAACAGCHVLMDPLGLSYEHYDAAGAWQDTEFGLAIDPSGAFTTINGASTPFSDALSLSSSLAANADVQYCMVLQSFRFMQQRGETAGDSCRLQTLKASFSASHHDLRALALAIVTDPSFTTLPAGK